MAKMLKMVDMEMDDEEKLDAAMPMPIASPQDYPFGLRICLTEKELEKLNLDPEEAETGGYIHGHFMGCITSVTSEDRDGKKSCRIEIQIESLAIESEDEENEEQEAEEEAGETDGGEEPTRKRSVLYG